MCVRSACLAFSLSLLSSLLSLSLSLSLAPVALEPRNESGRSGKGEEQEGWTDGEKGRLQLDGVVGHHPHPPARVGLPRPRELEDLARLAVVGEERAKGWGGELRERRGREGTEEETIEERRGSAAQQ